LTLALPITALAIGLTLLAPVAARLLLDLRCSLLLRRLLLALLTLAAAPLALTVTAATPLTLLRLGLCLRLSLLLLLRRLILALLALAATPLALRTLAAALTGFAAALTGFAAAAAAPLTALLRGRRHRGQNGRTDQRGQDKLLHLCPPLPAERRHSE
jgi:hypothetical protein